MGSGKAIVPNYGSIGGASPQESNVFISNITQHDLTVTVTFFKQDGTKLTTNITYFNFQNSDTEIGAGKTGYVHVTGTASWTYGYALVEWKNKGTDQDAVGLVAQAQRQEGTLWGYGIPVNQGLSF